MKGLRTIRQLLCHDDLITKVDLSDFYMHFLVCKADRRYMQFMWTGKKFQCIGMPFNLASALRLATKMMAPMIRYIRSCGLRVAIYIDDLISRSQSYKETIEPTQLSVATLNKLSLAVQPDQCQVVPSESAEFPGTWVNKKMHF